MRTVLKSISILALVLLTIPSTLFWAGWITLPVQKLCMTVATVLWFSTAPFWMGKESA